jgi:hypothetical protein
MRTWTADGLTVIGTAPELEIASRRPDGTLRDPVTTWVIRLGDGLYVRSVRGSKGAWYQGSQQRHEGHIKAGGVEKDVTFVDADHGLDDEIDAAYAEQYRHSPSAVSHITSPEARATTIKLVPR